jgi:hypothetical protein
VNAAVFRHEAQAEPLSTYAVHLEDVLAQEPDRTAALASMPISALSVVDLPAPLRQRHDLAAPRSAPHQTGFAPRRTRHQIWPPARSRINFVLRLLGRTCWTPRGRSCYRSA